MIYNKLVRDKIPAIIAGQDKSATYRILNDTEYRAALEKKLDEEVAEFHESKNPEELADILEVVEALAAVYSKRTKVHFEKVRKHAARGGFSKKYFLVEIAGNAETEQIFNVTDDTVDESKVVCDDVVLEDSQEVEVAGFIDEMSYEREELE